MMTARVRQGRLQTIQQNVSGYVRFANAINLGWVSVDGIVSIGEHYMNSR
jgi:hypothetical protein